MTVMSFDFSQITGYNRQILEGLRNSPKEFDRFLSSAAGQMRTFAKKTTRSATKKKTGNLLAGIDKGKPYEYQPGDHQVRVYNKAPHAWLVEHGHRIVIGKTDTGKRAEGRHPMGQAATGFAGWFEGRADDFVDRWITRQFLGKGRY